MPNKWSLALRLCVLAVLTIVVLSSTGSPVTAANEEVTTEEDHHDDEQGEEHGEEHGEENEDAHGDEHGGEHGGEHEEEIIRDYHLANLVICWMVLLLVDILGFPINTLALIALFKVRQKQPDCVMLITSMLSNYVVFLILIPMCLVALLKPGLVKKEFCYVHGELTFCYLLYNILAPATMGLDRADLVGRSHQRFFTITKAIVVQVIIICCAVGLTIAPLFAFSSGSNTVHEHSCHLWTVLVDDMVYFQVGSVSIGVTVTLITMIVCYGYIFRKVNRSVAAVTEHQKPALVVKPAVSAISASLDNTMTGGPGTSESQTESTTKNKKKNRRRADVRAAMTSVFVVSLFVLLWLPWIGVNMAIVNNAQGLPPELRVTTLIFVYIPAAVNPVTYSYMLPKISSYFAKLKKKYITRAKT